MANQLERASLDIAEEESLAAYSPDGSYGRRAAELLDSKNLQGLSSVVENDIEIDLHRSTQTPPSGIETKRKLSKQRQFPRIKPTVGRRPEATSVYRDQVYRFDGLTSAIDVPDTIVQTTANLSVDGYVFGTRNTISFWMRHAKASEANGMNAKAFNFEGEMDEHLLCATERLIHSRGTQVSINFGLAVDSSCRLVLRMRPVAQWLSQMSSSNKGRPLNAEFKQHATIDGDSFDHRPNEWKWRLNRNEACDSKWHLYTLNVEYPKAELFIDGEQFEENHENPSVKAVEITAETELAKPLDSPIVTIGGCRGLEGNRALAPIFGLFKGQLSGLSVLSHENEDYRTIECLGHCSESLVSTLGSSNGALQHDQESAPIKSQYHGSGLKIHQLDNSFVAYQESQSRIRMIGHDFIDIEEALGQIAYVNRRQLPSIGRRDIVLETKIDCAINPSIHEPQESSQFFSIPIEPIRVQIEVLPSTGLPKIVISGTPSLAREFGPIIQGVQPFGHLTLQVKRIHLRMSPIGPAKREFASRTTQRPALLNQELDYVEDSEDSSKISNYTRHSKSWRVMKDSSKRIGTLRYETTSGGIAGYTSWRRIEACTVRVYPPMNLQYEKLELPMRQLDEKKLYWRQSQDGFLIYGLDSVQNYQHLLRQVTYKNSEPARYSERLFKLVCSDMNGRLVSNEYLQTLTVIHPRSSLDSGRADWNKDEVRNDQLRPFAQSQGRFAALRIDEHALSWAHRDEHLDGQSGTSTKLDRIAMAFLVFVISLVVIMLLITLTNMRDPSFRDSRRAQSREQISSILYYDIDSDGQKGNQVGCFAHPEQEFSEDEDDDFGNAVTIHLDGELQSESRRGNESLGLDSLEWDNEQIESGDELKDEYDESLATLSDFSGCDSGAKIALNPLIHEKRGTPESRSTDERRAMVIEQRPSCHGKVRSYLSRDSFDAIQSAGEFQLDQLDYSTDEESVSSCSSSPSIGCLVIDQSDVDNSTDICEDHRCRHQSEPRACSCKTH